MHIRFWFYAKHYRFVSITLDYIFAQIIINFSQIIKINIESQSNPIETTGDAKSLVLS